MTESFPEIGIVTPSLDQAPFLERALESVSAQAGVRVEHVVVDGGSSDGSVGILRQRGSERLRWVSEADRGQSHAFNKGVAMLRAPIVGWLNADDLYVPGALMAVVRQFRERPDLDVVYGDTEEMDETGCPRRRISSRGFDVRSLLLQRFELYHPGMFYRRESLERIGPVAEDLHFVMDFDLALRIAHRCRVARIDAVLARHRVHSAAKSSRAPERFVSEYLTVLDRWFAQPSLSAEVRALRGAAYQAAHLEGAVRALRTGDRSAARGHLVRSLGARRVPDARTLKAVVLLIDALTGLKLGRVTIRALGGHA